MKKLITAFLMLSCVIVACSKGSDSRLPEEPEMTISTNSDPDPIDHPCCGDDDGDGGGGNSTNSQGYSTCTSASYTVRHRGQLTYNISFDIISGAIQNLVFNTSFYTAMPTLETLSLVSKSATYNAGNGVATITVQYKIVIRDQTSNYTYTQYVTAVDYMNLCDGSINLTDY